MSSSDITGLSIQPDNATIFQTSLTQYLYSWQNTEQIIFSSVASNLWRTSVLPAAGSPLSLHHPDVCSLVCVDPCQVLGYWVAQKGPSLADQDLANPRASCSLSFLSWLCMAMHLPKLQHKHKSWFAQYFMLQLCRNLATDLSPQQYFNCLQ